MEPEFRAKLQATPSEPAEAYVWFYVDEKEAPEKEWLIGEPSSGAATASDREASTRAGAVSIAAKLAAVPMVELSGNSNPDVMYGVPVVRIRATLAAFDAIGTWPEVWRIDPVPDHYAEFSDDYYYTTLENWPDQLGGYDGTGVTVATYEGDIPDSWANLPGRLPGSCQDSTGPTSTAKCHCPTLNHWNSHPRAMMGVVRRNTGILGMANGATTIMANHTGGCTTHGNDNYASALNWATANGATVISHSAGTGASGLQASAHDRFFDYKASVSPYPFIAGASANAPLGYVQNRMRNGTCVGGSIETAGADRSQVVMASTSWWNGAEGLEVPHVVALAEHVDTAGFALNDVSVTGGSSAATAEVAGIAASMQELNGTLKNWPEVMVPGLLVSANEDVDGVVLNLDDSVDDRDGAGLVNALQAWAVLQSSSKVDGGNVAAQLGHDYGSITSSSTPAQTYYSEVYNAQVPAGGQLRVASLLQARPTCPQNPGSFDCSADPYPLHALILYDGALLAGYSVGSGSNYQYIAKTNTSGATKTYTVRIYLADWGGLSATTWGLAWSSL